MRRVSWRGSGYPRASSFSPRSEILPSGSTERRWRGIALAVLLPRPGDRRLCSGESSDRHAVRRRRHVGEADLMAERDRRRIAAVLTADPDLEPRPRLASALDGDAHHRADAVAVEDLERVRGNDLLLDVLGEEALLRVVARDAKDRLRQVIRSEREELGLRGDLVGDEARARDLDHRAELVGDLLSAFFEDGLGYGDDLLLQAVELSHHADERHHDLRLRL